VSTLTKAVVAALVEAVHAVPVWDAAPVLYRIERQGPKIRLAAVDITPEAWSVPHTGLRAPEVLEVIAETFEALGVRGLADADRELFGMAFCHEGWTVPDELLEDYHQARQVEQMAGDHMLDRHPQRVEVRMMSAVDRRGLSYLVQHTRGGGTRHVVTSPGRAEAELAGAVFEALDRLVEQLTGVRAQPRRSSVVPDRSAN
jgi:hypothetical protein